MISENDIAQDLVLQTLKDKLGILEEMLDIGYWDQPLTGKHFGLAAAQLLYLFLELEKSMGTRIGIEHLHDYGFYSIDKIIGIVRQTIVAK